MKEKRGKKEERERMGRVRRLAGYDELARRKKKKKETDGLER